MTPDAGVLVAASRDDHVHHGPARRWLDGALGKSASGQRLLLLPTVAAGFLRIVTHPRIFEEPTPLDAALTFVRALRAASGVEEPPLGSELARLEALCSRHDLEGNDVPDAWIAAVVLDRVDHLVTFDRGFRRFLSPTQLTVLEPSS